MSVALAVPVDGEPPSPEALDALGPGAVVLLTGPDDPPDARAAVVAALGDGAAGAIAVAPVTDTIKQVDAAGRITGTLDRSGLVEPRVPQAYRAGALAAALRAAPPGAVAAAWRAGDHGVLPGLVAGTVRVVDLAPALSRP